jgi:hypothetical protein
VTPHELAAPAIHECIAGRAPVFVEETAEIPAQAIAQALDDLAEDWGVDVDYEVQDYRVAVLAAGRRADTRYDLFE